MTALIALIERAEAVIATDGADAEARMVSRIETAVREGADAGRVRELDHLLQIISYGRRVHSP